MGKAEDILDLENAGIVGTEVEVVSEVDEEVQNIGIALTTDGRPRSITEQIAHFFRSLTDQEFYTARGRHGRAMVIVRPTDERIEDRAADVLRLTVPKVLPHEAGPTFVWENEQTESIPYSIKGDSGLSAGRLSRAGSVRHRGSNASLGSCNVRTTSSRYRFLGIGIICLSMLVPRMLAQELRSSLIRAPYSLSFGEATVGKASDPQTITLLNTGTASVQLNKIVVTGDFSQTNNCSIRPAQLGLNQTCNIDVTFKSSSAGRALGTVSVFQDGSAIPLTVSLSGAGTLSVPIVKIYPVALNFPEQMTGPPSAPQTVTISNSGKRPLRLSSIDVDGDFTIMPGSTCESLSGSLTPDANCSVVVIFNPLDVGKRDGQITFMDDAEDSPQHVALSGIGK